MPVVNLPTRVRYLTAEEGGVSHFDKLWDNVRITALHTGLVVEKAWRGLRGLPTRGRRLEAEADGAHPGAPPA